MENDSQLLARLDERYKALDEKLDLILEQTTKTNGRVTYVENDIRELQQWREVLKGQWKLIVGAAGMSGAIIAFIINHFMK
jgi:hypothetical protein